MLLIRKKYLLWPISDNEIQRNPSLTQNPGY
ncbi:MAG: RagB/SusD family nutrient uptake outer membrane protein [Tannerellaceae bacterium]|nr:RagB/SusD family nutrient uptake outer membrane protein [Tannerellaceae bacterium]